MISREEPLWCDDEQRNAVLASPAHPLNGIDFVEYVRDTSFPEPDPRRHRIEVTFLKTPPPALIGAPASFSIEGGIRIVGVTVVDVVITPDPARLAVLVDREGDLSTYWLHVDHPQIDEERSEAAFSFKAGCPTEFDCRPRHDCEPQDFAEPALDYLAKDYQSFRRLMMDLAPQLNPDFTERNAADLTVSLIELFAYAGDYMSYYQDWAATEAFFDTCRDRISAARHTSLIDYRMHQGRNAHGFVQFDAAEGVSGIILAGTKLLTRVSQPLRGQPTPPGLVVPAGIADFDSDPALARTTVFETAAPVRVIADRNALRIHDWGDAACCLAKGAREAWLYAVRPAPGGDLLAIRPDFTSGEYLLIEEVLGPATGLAADADPRHRQVVRIEFTESTTDPVFRETLVGGLLTPIGAGDPPLPLLHVRWREADATTMPFCLSAQHRDTGQLIPLVTIARGNLAPADHGRTVIRDLPTPLAPLGTLPAVEPGTGRWPIDMQPLADGPLTFQTMPTDPRYAPDGRLATGRHDLETPASAAMPAITVEYGWDGASPELFRPVRSLIGSDPFDAHFVAEIGNGGSARLRFGDDQYGRRVGQPVSAHTRYRIGNGRVGNIGAGSLIHLVEPDAADLVDPANPGGGAVPFPALQAIRQPLPAKGGVDPETIEEARQLAPEAFRAVTFRAVTERDYEAAAMKLGGVAAAKTHFVWTGSWHTVFVALHPADPALLDRMPGGGALLKPGFAAKAGAWLNRYRLAGYDLAVRAAVYVPIELEIRLCIARGYFQGEVLEAVSDALSNRRLPGGQTGFFHPTDFSFGSAVYSSRIYALLQNIDGVESATIHVMKRYWDVPNGELERGLVPMGPDEIARLDNDRNQPEFGVLRLSAVGGL
jgi:hypothetical protein